MIQVQMRNEDQVNALAPFCIHRRALAPQMRRSVAQNGVSQRAGRPFGSTRIAVPNIGQTSLGQHEKVNMDIQDKQD